MRKYLLYFVGIGLFVVGAFAFGLLSQEPSLTKDPAPLPFAVRPVCEDNDTAISITEDHQTICKHEATIYQLLENKRVKIGVIRDIDTVIPGTLGYFIGVSAHKIIIFRVTQSSALLTVYSVDITKDIFPVSAFFLRADSALNVFVSAQKEATSPTSEKSLHYRIQILGDQAETPTLTTYGTVAMLRVVAAFNEGNLVFFRELYPFLSEKWRVAKIEEKLSFISPKPAPQHFFPASSEPLYAAANSKIYEITGETEAPAPFSQEEILVYGTQGVIHHDRDSQELRWYQFSTENSPLTLLSFVTSPQYELAGRYSTRIGKRVYNCFDFSESLQITLRTCVPQL